MHSVNQAPQSRDIKIHLNILTSIPAHFSALRYFLTLVSVTTEVVEMHMGLRDKGKGRPLAQVIKAEQCIAVGTVNSKAVGRILAVRCANRTHIGLILYTLLLGFVFILWE